MGFIILIPLLPLIAFLMITLNGRRLDAEAHRISIPALAISFVLSIAAFAWVVRNGPVRLELYSFIESGSLRVNLGLFVDTLAALILLLVTGVSTLVHIFSARYMSGDPRFGRFFSVLSLFTFAMLMLVMSANLLMLYAFWEIMGICSYLLISHAAERSSAGASATRAFLVNAVADVGLGLGVLLSFVTFGTLDIQEILISAKSMEPQTVNLLSFLGGWLGLEWQVGVMTLIAILFLIGAMGKSAQVPLHVWLPFAMEAPTPVSALIHAATMVKAGIFLVARLSPIFILSVTAMNLMIVVGGITALFAAAVALTQNDIKRILAYSTMSQLGFMIMTCGAGAFLAAIFHLLAHGALKAYLFLASGSALEQSEGAHEHPRGKRPLPFYLAALVLAWLPPALIAWSGYGLLWASPHSPGPSPLFWAVALATAFLTALYLFRWIHLTGDGARAIDRLPGLRGSHPLRAAGSPSGTFPAVLIGGAVTVVLALTMAFIWNGFAHALAPAFPFAASAQGPAPGPGIGLPVLLLTLSAATGGWVLAYRLTARPLRLSPWMEQRVQALYVHTHNKWYFDEIYDNFIVRPTLGFSRWLWERVDIGIIEQAIGSAADRTTVFARWLWLSVDIRGLGIAVEGSARITLAVARWLWHSVDIRALGWVVDASAGLMVRVARWLWQSLDIRGLERLVGRIGRQNEAAGRALREIEPSMLQHHLLVMIFTLVAVMILFLIFIL